MPRSPASSGEISTKVSGVLERMPFAPVSQVAFVEVLEQAAVVEPQIELGVGPQGWLRPGDREQPCLAVREVEPLRVEQRLVGAVGSDRPLQRTVSLQPLVAHPGEQRGERRDFAHDLARMLVMPPRAETVRDLLDDLPVRSAALERLEDPVEPLDPPLGAGERPLLFEARRGGQDDVGVAAGLAEEDVLDDEEVELLQGTADVVRVRIDVLYLLAEEVHCFELALVNR